MQYVFLAVNLGQIDFFPLAKGRFLLYNIQKGTEKPQYVVVTASASVLIRKNELRSGAFIFIKHTIAKQAANRRPVLPLRRIAARFWRASLSTVFDRTF